MDVIKPAVMDAQQVAVFLQESDRSVRRKTAAGKLPGFRKVGGNARWVTEIVEAWLIAGCPENAITFEQEWISNRTCLAMPGQLEKSTGNSNTNDTTPAILN